MLISMLVAPIRCLLSLALQVATCMVQDLVLMKSGGKVCPKCRLARLDADWYPDSLESGGYSLHLGAARSNGQCVILV